MHVRRDLGGSAVRIDGRDAETGAPQHRLGNSCFFVSSMAGRFKPNHASEIRSFERTLSFVGQIGGRELSFA
jgi:hypothetical protein